MRDDCVTLQIAVTDWFQGFHCSGSSWSISVCFRNRKGRPDVHRTSREVGKTRFEVFKAAPKMAASSSTCNDDVASNWKTVGDLGMEVALRNIRCSEARISRALDENSSDSLDISKFVRRSSVPKAGSPTSSMSGGLDLREEGPERYTEQERCTILATVGRSNSDMIGMKVKVKDLTESEVTAFCVNLESNTNITKISGRGPISLFMTGEGCSLLGNALATNSTVRRLSLRDVGMDCKGLSCLMEGLQSNKTIESLDLSYNPLGDEGVCMVVEFLVKRAYLEKLSLKGVGCCLEGAKSLSSALASPSTIVETLHFGMFYVDKDDLQSCYIEIVHTQYNCLNEDTNFGADLIQGYGVLLEATVPSDGSKMNHLRKLVLHFPDILQNEDQTYMQGLIKMITTNQTLTDLALLSFKLPPGFWKNQFIPALKFNKALQQLNLSSCQGLSEDVLEAMLDVFQNSSTGLENIDLQNTGLHNRNAQLNRELMINKDYRSALRSQPKVPATSGRLVLCGSWFGGKTEISKTIHRIDKRTSQPHALKKEWKKLMQAHPALRRSLFGKAAYLELKNRTRGCDISGLEKQGYLKSIWDFAGQKEYYALHDYLFPDMYNSCFFFVCSSRGLPDLKNPEGFKDEKTMREECTYWMKFLGSNSKVRIGEDGQRHLPHVVFVLTKVDTLDSDRRECSEANAKKVVKDLRSQFDGVVELYDTVQFVDACSDKDVKKLITVAKEVLEKILKRQTEYTVCQEVRKVLDRWSEDPENELKPVLKLDEFVELCQKQVERLVIQEPLENEVWSIVLAYLNDIGEIIYLKGLNFIVTKPRWFGVGVLGYLINAFKSAEERTGLLCHRPASRYQPQHEEGFLTRENMEILLKRSLKTTRLQGSVTTDELANLMIELEMCYKKDPNKTDSSLFMPALFDDDTDNAAQGRRQLEWKLNEGSVFIYLGRRLSCEEKSEEKPMTFLTPGFFPRWQVHMLNYIHRKKWVSNRQFQIGRNMIGFSHNSIEVLIEYSGDIDYFVDILVRSSKSYAEALNFIETHVLQNIRQFCASPQGCEGVILEASVIRPECLLEPDKCIDRKDQVVLISFLEDKLVSDPGFKHTWDKPHRGDDDTSSALYLLEGDSSYTSQGKSLADQISDSWANSSRWGDDLPKLIFPSLEDVGMFRKLVTNLNLRKQIAFKVHLLCDNKGRSHPVAGQPGRTWLFNCNDKGVDFPIAKYFLMFAYTTLSAAATVAGAVFPFPSLDKVLTVFDRPTMSINKETLLEIESPAQADAPVSNEDIRKILSGYMNSDPHALGLRQFLKLDEFDQFWNDFRLRKVVYTTGPYQNKIGWVCTRCYTKDSQILKTVPQ